MKEARQSTIVQGAFGRVTLNLTARGLVEHAHSEYNFIFKVGGADSGFRVGDAVHGLTDSQAIFVNPWEPHAKLNSEGGATLALTFLFNAAWLAQTLGILSAPKAKLFPRACEVLTPAVQDQVMRLAISMTSGIDVADDDREPLLRDLARQLATEYADHAFTRQSLMAERPMDARIMRATRFLREQAASNPNLEAVASQVGLSRSRFFEQFKNCVGASPQQYLDWQRMALATRMLSNPEFSVAQVSDDLGFSAPSHFARFFSQHIGLPPSDFKRGMLSQAVAHGG